MRARTTRGLCGHRRRGNERMPPRPQDPDTSVHRQSDAGNHRRQAMLYIGLCATEHIGCDYFSSYQSYMRRFDTVLQFCIAHLIRDVRFLTNLPDKETQAYGHRILDGIRALFKVIHTRDSLSETSLRAALDQVKQTIITAATTHVPSFLDKNGKELKRHAKNMADRFRKHGEAYFTFITTPGMEPTNNLAEQAIRFIVIDRHVPQGTRGEAGRKTAERLWTVVGTCQLQGRSAFNFIHAAVHAYFHGQPAPSLLPSPT